MSIRIITRLASEADVDPRTARKAFRYGADAVRGRAGARLAEVAAREGIVLGLALRCPPGEMRSPSWPPHAA